MRHSSTPEPLSPILPLLPSPPPPPPPPLQQQQQQPSSSSPPPLQLTNKQQQPFIENKTHWKSDTKNFRIQGWDPILIISQILAIQAIHYLVLSLIIPPMLYFMANPIPLEYEGGARNVAMIIDWRAMVGRSTLHLNHHHDAIMGGLAGFGKLPNSLGRKPFRTSNSNLIHPSLKSNLSSSNTTNNISLSYPPFNDDWLIHNLNHSNLNSILFYDSNRSWVISSAWFISSLIGVIILYEIVRRPKQIMDHSLTIGLNHLILTTYYSARLPTSLWFYSVLLASSIVQIVLAEQLCVRREFREGLGVGWKVDHRPDDN